MPRTVAEADVKEPALRNQARAVLPDELGPATVASEPATLSGDPTGRSVESQPESHGELRIAHVQAGDQGVEDVEVTLNCPHCQGEILLDVANEEALLTAMSWLEEVREDEQPEPMLAVTEPVEDESGVHRSATERPRIAGLAVHDELLAELDHAPVLRAMNGTVRSVGASASLAAVAQDIALGDASATIVTDEDDRPIGIVTPTQVLRAASSLDPPALDRTRVDQVMGTDLFCLRVDAPLTRAVELFSTGGAKRITVIGDDGKLRGVLRPLDLLRFLVRAAPAATQTDGEAPTPPPALYRS